MTRRSGNVSATERESYQNRIQRILGQSGNRTQTPTVRTEAEAKLSTAAATSSSRTSAASRLAAQRDQRREALDQKKTERTEARDARLDAASQRREDRTADRSNAVTQPSSGRESVVNRLAAQRDQRREALDQKKTERTEARDVRLDAASQRREDRTADRSSAVTQRSSGRESVVDRLAAQRDARRDALNGRREERSDNRDARLDALDTRREERSLDRDTRISALRDRIDARRNPSELSDDTKPSRSIVRNINRSTTYDTVTTPDGVQYVRRDVRDVYYKREVNGRRMDRSYERTLHTERERVLWVKDRPHDVRHTYHDNYTYFDGFGHAHHRSVWPSFRFVVNYGYGGCYDPYYYYWGYPTWSFRYVYPYYHRKYVFVSLGGYWPVDYSYRRYYWYGCHPYEWYGYYPVPYEVGGDTYNYYTYNYYGDTDAGYSTDTSYTTTSGYAAQGTNQIQPVDHTTFEDVREKLAQETPAEPAEATAADMYFETAVKAFEAGDFDKAAEQFALARTTSPEDTVLPFAYSQALFAKGQYVESAAVLREALAKVEPAKEGVFYPRGLYGDEELLITQLESLQTEIEKYPFDANLQLLMGYHLLGIGETEAAVEPLQNASLDLRNAESATVLLNLAAKLLEAKQAAEEATDQSQTTEATTPAVTPQSSAVGTGTGESIAPATSGSDALKGQNVLEAIKPEDLETESATKSDNQ